MIANKMAATSNLKAELEAGSSAVAAEPLSFSSAWRRRQAQIDSAGAA